MLLIGLFFKMLYTITFLMKVRKVARLRQITPPTPLNALGLDLDRGAQESGISPIGKPSSAPCASQQRPQIPPNSAVPEA
jgi:hypothetical protein